MIATEQDITLLKKLQKVDRKVATAKKEFEELPHRKAILEVRKNKDDVLRKKVQVQDMLDEAEGSLSTLAQEDEVLAQKQDDIAETLAEVQGDYRAVTSHTRELDGVRKRREKISVELARIEEKINKINPVMKQVMQALGSLEQKEAELIASFQKTGGSLRTAIAEGEKTREELSKLVDPAVLQVYEQTRERCGGVALATLNGTACGTCRASFDQGKLSKIRSEAPLATCPACHRILIVEEEG